MIRWKTGWVDGWSVLFVSKRGVAAFLETVSLTCLLFPLSTQHKANRNGDAEQSK